MRPAPEQECVLRGVAVRLDVRLAGVLLLVGGPLVMIAVAVRLDVGLVAALVAGPLVMLAVAVRLHVGLVIALIAGPLMVVAMALKLSGHCLPPARVGGSVSPDLIT